MGDLSDYDWGEREDFHEELSTKEECERWLGDMVSDCGNEIKSVKFIVWLYSNEGGFLELACDKDYKPEGVKKKYDFSDLAEMRYLMKVVSNKVREYDNKTRTERRKRNLKKARFTLYCPRCDSGLLKTTIELLDGNGVLIASCRSCKCPVEKL